MKQVQLKMLPIQDISHNPVIKKQMLIGFDELRPLTQFARAVFPPGESASGHSHADMAEVFFAEKGCGNMRVNGVDYSFAAGDCITVSPGEIHELSNPSADELIVMYFGVIISKPSP